ncbi:hypothetical protein GLOIN_2v275216 [Rhizophagus irregularis DAOM 181602=DAOM 197198]|nr:hypothetical protein GLOIN_2v275216 [Rhizophagus irregularis DAOM 181602=DAOM 197198]
MEGWSIVNSQDITNEFLDEGRVYYDKAAICGISQNPNTKDYIIVFNSDQYFEYFCNKCTNKYTDVKCKCN